MRKEKHIPTREEIIQKLRREYPYLKGVYGVKRIGLFGSFAKESATPDSDVDLIIEFERPIGLQFMELGSYRARVSAPFRGNAHSAPRKSPPFPII